MASAMPTALAAPRPRVALAPCPCGSGNWTRAGGVPRCVCGRALVVAWREAEREEGARG